MEDRIVSESVRPGDWVRIHLEILAAEERSPGIPSDTAAHPYEGWINGWATEAATVGEMVTIRTLTGRSVRGTLVESFPGYRHGFGKPNPALLAVGPSLRKLLKREGE
jgi:hypothetical protein